jgi:DNA repair exonuclease SbcCD ATPase subunit
METPREMFFDSTWISQDNREALQWGQGRIQYLEEQAKAMLGVFSEKERRIASLQSSLEEQAKAMLGARSEKEEEIASLEKHASEMAEFLEQIEKKIADLESHLHERNATIDELKAEIKLSQAAVSGTSEKSRENKGDDMGDMTAAKITGHRMIFEDVVLHLKNGIHIDLRATSDDAASIIWASERINELEMANKKQGDEMTETSDEALQQKLFKRLNDLAAHKPTNLESDEDRHQRHRRERMMDEVTLICVRGGIEQVDSGRAPEKTWGRLARDSAENICDGIMEFDAKQ